MEIRKPNVLVAGFPRTGSTYLYHLLKQHPDIHIPSLKEINYFNKDHFFLGSPEILNPRHFKSLKWYYSFFKTNKKIAMDFSIISALDIGSAERARKILGDIKILFIIRNKEDFLKSVLHTMKKWGKIYPDYQKYANFDYYINNYKQHFSKIYVISIEQINKNPQKELNLNVPKHESKKERKKVQIGYWLKHRFYMFSVKLFYKMISFTVRASAKPPR